MRRLGGLRGAALVLATVSVAAPACRNGSVPKAEPVQVAAGIDHSGWDRLLGTYVDEVGLVDYAAWKASPADRRALSDYLQRFAAAPQPAAQGSDLAASLINGYNASVIAWILDHYPTGSIRAMKDSFTGPHHRFGGRTVSLDAIEHDTLRPREGFRVHAVLVCAARSCPPLSRRAYRPDRLDEQLDEAMQRWLARPDLNQFDPSRGRVRVSQIFNWFAGDFQKGGGLPAVLRRYGPPPAREVAERKGLRIEYLPYDWSLNDRGGAGASYSRIRLWWDQLRSKLP